MTYAADLAVLIRAWEANGRVGPHPASARARFERGEDDLPAETHTAVYSLVPAPRRPPKR